LSLDLGECVQVPPLRFGSVLGAEAAGDLGLADDRHEVGWNALADPVDAGLGVLVGRLIARAMCITRV
jgi:hypothetical protein